MRLERGDRITGGPVGKMHEHATSHLDLCFQQPSQSKPCYAYIKTPVYKADKMFVYREH